MVFQCVRLTLSSINATAHHKLGRGREDRGQAGEERFPSATMPSSFLPTTRSLTRPSVRPSIVRSKCQGDQLQLRHLLQIVKCHMSERTDRSTLGTHVPYSRRRCSEGRTESLSETKCGNDDWDSFISNPFQVQVRVNGRRSDIRYGCHQGHIFCSAPISTKYSSYTRDQTNLIQRTVRAAIYEYQPISTTKK